MPVDFDSLGNYLRQERERQQVSLQDISAATKIQLKFLEALEHDAYDQLPAEPFVVGFLRAYAQYIALDPAAILAAYRSLHRIAEPVEMPAQPVSVSAPVPERRRLVRLGMFIALFGILTSLVLYELRRGQQTRSTVTSFPAALPAPGVATPGEAKGVAPPVVAAPPLPAAPAPPVVAAPDSRPGLATLGASEAASLLAPPAPARVGGGAETPGTLVLEAKAVTDTWLGIEIDGGKRQNMLLTSGKSGRWEAQERFRVTVGNARGTRLALNGQEVPLQAGRSNVMRDLVLTRTPVQ